MAVQQSSMRYEIPSERGSIYDRTGTVVLATSVVARPLAANPKLLTPERRAEVAAKLVELLGLEGEAADEPDDQDDLGEGVRRPGARPRAGDLRPDPRAEPPARRPSCPGLILEPEQVRLYPQPGGGPDTTLAAHLLGFVNREGVGQYGVEQYYQDDLAGMPTRGRRPEGRLGQRRPGHLHGARGGLPGPGPHAHDRRVAAGRGRAGAAVRLDRRPRQARLGGRDGSVHRRGRTPTRATRRTTPTTTRRSRPRTPARFVDPIVSTVYEPGSVFKMMTADRRAGRRDGDHEDEDQRHRARCGSTAARRGSTTRTTRRWA